MHPQHNDASNYDLRQHKTCSDFPFLFSKQRVRTGQSWSWLPLRNLMPRASMLCLPPFISLASSFSLSSTPQPQQSSAISLPPWPILLRSFFCSGEHATMQLRHSYLYCSSTTFFSNIFTHTYTTDPILTAKTILLVLLQDHVLFLAYTTSTFLAGSLALLEFIKASGSIQPHLSCRC